MDGLVALLLMCQWADSLGLTYSYYVNSNRYHGFELNLADLKGYLIIASDFTITEDEVKAIVDNDIVLLSTDHHDIQDSFIDYKSGNAEGIVINNQYPFEPEDNRYQSGAGVFYELICELYPDFKSKERTALVGVTLLSDMRPIENDKAKQYLRTTYSIDTDTPYISYLITSACNNDFGFGKPKFDRNFIDYTLTPIVNALLRADKTEEAVKFILGGGLTSFDAKGLQKQLIEDMYLRCEIQLFNNVVYLVANTSQFLDYHVKISNYIGLFCNDYKDKHNGVSVLGIVIENGKIIRASFRGKYDDIHYRSGFRNLGINAQGHPGAFGILDFYPDTDTWYQIDDLIGDLEANHHQTITVVKATNLAFILNRDGANMAMNNCYVRDMYRTYIRYTGSNIKIKRQTYKSEEFTQEDYRNGVRPDEVIRGVNYKYVRDAEGNPVPKYIEYLVDGRQIKSFGDKIEDGLILPILEKGYMQLYVRSSLN
jgi:single-stranded-DNA-specific exonuclease